MRTPRPRMGDWRIEEVVLEGGDTYYMAQEYGYGPTDDKGWVTKLTSPRFTDVKAYVDQKMATRVATRRVVWP